MTIYQITCLLALLMLIVLMTACGDEQVDDDDFVYDFCPEGESEGELTSIEIGLLNALEAERCAKITRTDLANITHLDASVEGFGGYWGGDAELLQYCINLQVLDLSGVQFGHFWVLYKLKSLQELNLQENFMTAILPLGSMPKLRRLNLASNRICDLFPIHHFVQLEYLNLAQNTIADIELLVNNVGLSQGDTVILEDNPLSQVSVEQHIPALEARGVIVKW